MVRRLEHWPAADRLKDLSMFSLRTTRLQEDLTAACSTYEEVIKKTELSS